MSRWMLAASLALLGACGEEVGGQGEPCYDNDTCDEGLSCVSGSCVSGVCGDGQLDPGEACDDGLRPDQRCAYGESSCSVCTPGCELTDGVVSYCGDGAVDPAEACDDGNTVTEQCPYDSPGCVVCSGACQWQIGTTSLCGNGVVEAERGETCDDGNTITEACPYGAPTCEVCAADCTTVSGAVSYCGDGVIDGLAGEACDDGNDQTEATCADGRVSCAVCAADCQWSEATLDAVASHIILLIGDGMGRAQAEAGSLYAYGEAGDLAFEAWPYQGHVATDDVYGDTTDSAASGTAIATGTKVASGVISVAIPGDGAALETILETFADRGLATGLVTTTQITHATPASFGAHVESRNEQASIATQLLTQSQPDVLLGGATYVDLASAEAAGYTVVTTREELLALDPTSVGRVSGQFGDSHLPYELDGLGALPHLAEMTQVAIDILARDPDGFFLMVEGGRIDHACHGNDLERAVHEVIGFDDAVSVAAGWAAGRADTLLLVTADHETGGLQIEAAGALYEYPTVSWLTTGHTSTQVPVYGWGVGADVVPDVLENSDLYDLMMAAGTAP